MNPHLRLLGICHRCAAILRQRQPLHSGRKNAPGPHQYHSSTPTLSTEPRQTTSSEQAIPLSGYYADLLTPSSAKPTRTTGPSPPPVPPQSQSERAKILFGTGSRVYKRGESPQSTWRTVNGVPIPPRPAEPDNCCMSGCVHCVWDDYRDEVEDWADRVRTAQAKAHGELGGVTPKQRVGGRREVQEASTSMDDDGGGSETNWGLSGGDEDAVIEGLARGQDLFEAIPVGIREFIKTEKRLRDLHRRGTEQSQI